MKFQFTNSTLGSKNILLSAINKMLNDASFRESLLSKVENTPNLKDDKSLKQKIAEGLIDLDCIEVLKNELMSPVLSNTVVFGGKGAQKNPREILQGLGDELRGINPDIFLGFLGSDILAELEDRGERIDLKSFIGGSGTGKDTIGQFFFDSATDGRTVSEMDFLEGLNACLTYEDQKSYLKSFMFNLDLGYKKPEVEMKGFEKYLFESIEEAVETFNSQKPERDFSYKKDPNPKRLITFISRPVLEQSEYRGDDYKEYIEMQKKVYAKNNIPFTKENREIFGYIREGVNVHHYTEKLNQVIRIYNNSNGKSPEEVAKELDFVLSFGGLNDVQKKEFRDYFVRLKSNPEKLEVIENKYLEETKSMVMEGIFKKSIENCKGDFKFVEYEESNIKNNPMKVVKNTTVFFDFDDVIADLIPEWLEDVNEKLGTGHTVDEFERYWWFNDKAEELLRQGKTEEEVDHLIWNFLQSDVYNGKIKRNENIIGIMSLLKQMGFTVKVLTAELSVSKREFVKKYLPFIHPKKDVVATGDKFVVEGNCVLVDDAGDNVEDMVKNNEEAHCIMIDKPYNQYVKTYGGDGRITRVKIGQTKKILDLVLAKAYASNARKLDFLKNLERMEVELTEEDKELLKGISAQEALAILRESLRRPEPKKGKYP